LKGEESQGNGVKAAEGGARHTKRLWHCHNIRKGWREQFPISGNHESKHTIIYTQVPLTIATAVTTEAGRSFLFVVV
jgi:hypothetical protein